MTPETRGNDLPAAQAHCLPLIVDQSVSKTARVSGGGRNLGRGGGLILLWLSGVVGVPTGSGHYVYRHRGIGGAEVVTYLHTIVRHKGGGGGGGRGVSWT